MRGATGEFEKRTGVHKSNGPRQCGTHCHRIHFCRCCGRDFVGPSATINGYIKSRGEKFVIVAGSASGGAGLVVRQDSRNPEREGFGGKTIATPQLGNTQDIAARVWLADKDTGF